MMLISAASSLRKVCVPLRPALFTSSTRRRRFGSSENEVRKGLYGQATEEAAFKHILYNENLCNSFMSAILGETIIHSEILDASLRSPAEDLHRLRKVINKPGIEELMQEIADGVTRPKVTNRATNRTLSSLDDFLLGLSIHYHHLLHALPLRERNTPLEIVCQTRDGLVQVEVQVQPQDLWDIRILSGVSQLFDRFYPHYLDNDEIHISRRVRRVVGVSIFEKAPVHQVGIRKNLPWYDAAPWNEGELRRHYRLTEQSDNAIVRPGIEFFDFNLGAVSLHNPCLLKQPVALQEWLEFFAHAHYKHHPQELKTPELKDAYRMMEMDSWDEKLKAEYLEQQAQRYNISQNVRGEKEQGRAEGE